MEIVIKLAKLAEELDTANHLVLADAVDNINKQIVKTAQYVGTQGYWIRNERCWSNCYRQKRASQPGTPAQKIWMECQSEYQDALNEDYGKWDKYAASSGLEKTADADTVKKFATTISEMPGEDIGEKVYALIGAAAAEYRQVYSSGATQLRKLAELQDNITVANMLNDAANDLENSLHPSLEKAAQWNTGFMGGIKNWWNKNQADPNAYITNLEQQLQKVEQLGRQRYTDPSVSQQYEQATQQLNSLIDKNTKSMNQMVIKNPGLENSLKPIVDSLIQVRNTIPGQRLNVIRKALQTVRNYQTGNMAAGASGAAGGAAGAAGGAAAGADPAAAAAKTKIPTGAAGAAGGAAAGADPAAAAAKTKIPTGADPTASGDPAAIATNALTNMKQMLTEVLTPIQGDPAQVKAMHDKVLKAFEGLGVDGAYAVGVVDWLVPSKTTGATPKPAVGDDEWERQVGRFGNSSKQIKTSNLNSKTILFKLS